MPYIEQHHRPVIDNVVNELATVILSNCCEMSPSVINHDGFHTTIKGSSREGDLNYAITKLMTLVYPNPKYAEYNAMIGLVECIKLEAYRKIVAPYEDEKESLNGPVV